MFAREEAPHPGAKAPHPSAEARRIPGRCVNEGIILFILSLFHSFENVGVELYILYYIYKYIYNIKYKKYQS